MVGLQDWNFLELSRKVKLSSTVPAQIELQVIQRLIKQVVGRDVQIYCYK